MSGTFLRNCFVEEMNERVLHWNYRGLTELPSDLLHSKVKTTDLYLKLNNISSLPGWISKLDNLTNLYLYGNQLKELPLELGQLKLLQILDLQRNYISNLPESIGDLKNLIYLNLERNSIERLPNNFASLKSLATLNLKNNKLKALPNSICTLRSLDELVLDNNNLENLPKGIVHLPNLTFLSVRNNDIEYLPFLQFENRPTLCYQNNYQLNYISYELGDSISGTTPGEDYWWFTTEGCFKTGEPNTKEKYINLNCVRIHVPQKNATLSLPQTIKKVYAVQLEPPSALEICLRKLYTNLIQVKGSHCFNIPWNLPIVLEEMLNSGPTARCLLCQVPLFTEALIATGCVPTKEFIGEDHIPREVIFVSTYCSAKCSNEFKIRHNFISLTWEINN